MDMIFFKEKGVGLINSAPLSMGLLTDIGPPNWHRAPENVRNAARMASNYCQVYKKFFLYYFIELLIVQRC